MRPVDLRSDTVTRPTHAMRRAMAEAEVGDACFGDDPTVTRLEAIAAERLGKEAAIFVASGTMANQIAVAAHVRPGDAVLVEARAHIAAWEGAGAAAHSGAQLRPVASRLGLPTVAELEAAIFPDHAKAPRLTLLGLENTHNAAGGVPHSAEETATLAAWARSRGLAVHLDGARLCNAAIALDQELAALAGPVDTVTLCLSKGLGAPIGSVLAGPRDVIAIADRARHRLGGGWRQAGLLAAAGIHALTHHVQRLADDHARAARIAEALEATGAVTALHEVRTNLICYEVSTAWGSAADLTGTLAGAGVLVSHTGRQTGRIVTHLDVDDAGVERVLTALRELE